MITNAQYIITEKCYAQLLTPCSNVQTRPVVTGVAVIMAHKLKTRHHELLRMPTGRSRAPGPHYWIGPANAGCASHHKTYCGTDVDSSLVAQVPSKYSYHRTLSLKLAVPCQEGDLPFGQEVGLPQFLHEASQ